MSGERRYVVARRWTGIGDCLVSLLAAHRYARATGRSLLVDWRHSSYASPDRNLFADLFAAPPDWDGVPTIADQRVTRFDHPGPYWPGGWSAAELRRPPVQGERGDTRAAIDLIVDAIDVADAVVVFDGCIAPAVPDLEVRRRLLGALGVREDLRATVRAYSRERFADRPVVGVHVRHGNGGNIGGHARYWERPGEALLTIAGAARRASDTLQRVRGGTPVVFLCTDSPEVETAMRRLVPGLEVRPKAFRPPGAGELHRWAGASTGLDDALIEMLLLAEVDVLVRYPPGSYFSVWGETMKRPAPPGCRPPAGSEPGLGPAIV